MPSTVRAFTLIELIISCALGAVIVYTAFSAFRVAADTVATANRLSTTNQLIRAGFQASRQEIDWWLSYDDPTNSANQHLRQQVRIPIAGSPDVVQGLPFTPMPANDFFAAPSGLGAPFDEGDRGWDGAYAWPVSDPRTWWRGNLAEQNTSDNRFGRYGMFASHEANVDLDSDGGSGGWYGSVSTNHRWLYRQMNNLYWALGYYGWLEYMPANTIYAWYQGYSGGTTNGGIPQELIRPGTSFSNRDGSVGYARGNYLLTFGSSFGVPSVTESQAYNDLRDVNRRLYETNYFNLWEASSIPEFERRTENRSPLLALAPTHWPRLRVAVGRFIKDSRYVASTKVRWTDPITGAVGELSSTGFGTTLRGARQQRARAGGWARWDNATTASNDATLDDY